MAKFKVIVSDPETGTSKVVELAEARASPLIGKRIGEIMDGAVVDLPGHKIQITGGSDKDGFPMRPSVHGGVRRSIVLSGGVGVNPTNEGKRRRQTNRGKGNPHEKSQKKAKEKKEEKAVAPKEAEQTTQPPVQPQSTAQ